MDPQTTMAAAAPASLALESQPDGQSSSSGKGSTAKRKPVRRDPEKRRQQNVQAQIKYREKLKKRLNDLEALAASVTGSRGVTLAAAAGAGSGVVPMPQSGPSNSTTTECQSPCSHMGQSPNDHSGGSSVGFSDFDFSASISPASSSDVALWDPAASIDPSALIQNEDTGWRPQYWVGVVDCGCYRAHIQLTPSGPRERRDLQILNVGPSPFGADPYANALRVERLCIAQAILSNCSHIGITEKMLCDDDAVSPFFRPSDGTVGDSGSDNVVRTMQSIFKTLKPDVRPIREQITHAHPPYIDVLPFPTFRKNLIRSGGAVDEDEFYDDMLNGLICWGRAGVGRRDRDCSTGYVSTGTPWDSRSWEARTWFLQKYWALLGGDEGELVRQSEWWRNMRGDDADLWSGVQSGAGH